MKVKLIGKALVPRGDNPQNGYIAEDGAVVELADEHAEHLIANGAAEKSSAKTTD